LYLILVWKSDHTTAIRMIEKFEQISILGAGLLGGSLGIDIKSLSPETKVAVWSRSEKTREKCRTALWCDEVHDSPAEACHKAGLVILCTTVEHIPHLLEEISGACREGALITDVGSTKKTICEQGHRLFPENGKIAFLGSHPMAGSEKAGIDAARADLFREQSCIITPWPGNSTLRDKESGRLKLFWESLGMRVFFMQPDLHDKLVGSISHLPHAVAVALIHTVARSPELWTSCAGRGLKDTTRIAAGDPALWNSIFRENKNSLVGSLREFRREIDVLLELLETNDTLLIEQYLQTGADLRKKLS